MSFCGFVGGEFGVQSLGLRISEVGFAVSKGVRLVARIRRGSVGVRLYWVVALSPGACLRYSLFLKALGVQVPNTFVFRFRTV